MKSPTVKIKISLFVFVLGVAMAAQAQVSQSNVLQYPILREGQDSINKSLRVQGNVMTKTALEGNVMADAFSQIKKWEKQYNSYLTNVGGYASTIKAASTLYAEGVVMLRNLYHVKKAVGANPQGVAASLSMNNLYVEVTVELIRIYRLLRVVAYNDKKVKSHELDYESVLLDKWGGSAVPDSITNKNMLTGAERTQLLWAINDSMAELNRKLRALAISIAYYNMVDVWNSATAGMLDKTHGDIAKDAKERWRRAAKVQKILE